VDRARPELLARLGRGHFEGRVVGDSRRGELAGSHERDVVGVLVSSIPFETIRPSIQRKFGRFLLSFWIHGYNL